MKGISVIIATIILVVITIGLVATAYIYISGLLTSSTARNINLANAVCNSTGYITVIVQNIGTADIDGSKISVYVNGNKDSDCTFSGTLSPGDSVSCTTSNYDTGKWHDVTVVGPGNSVSARVPC